VTRLENEAEERGQEVCSRCRVKQSRLIDVSIDSCPIHTADADATKQFRRVGVGGVYWTSK